jgi:hypothetical protein
MDLLERYLQAVGQYLPAKGRNDTASVNYSVNLGFKIVLAVSLVKFAWDIGQMIVRSSAKSTGFVRAL